MPEDMCWEIRVTGTRDQEWQGTVRLPATGEQRPFRSLLELIRIMERMEPGGPGSGER